jgi:hypothetical protein
MCLLRTSPNTWDWSWTSSVEKSPRRDQLREHRVLRPHRGSKQGGSHGHDAYQAIHVRHRPWRSLNSLDGVASRPATLWMVRAFGKRLRQKSAGTNLWDSCICANRPKWSKVSRPTCEVPRPPYAGPVWLGLRRARFGRSGRWAPQHQHVTASGRRDRSSTPATHHCGAIARPVLFT